MKVLSIPLLILLLFSAAFAAEALPSIASPKTGKLTVAIFVDPPYTMKTDDGRWTGFNVDVWSEVARTLNLDYEFREMKVAEVTEALHQNTVDFCVSSLFLTPEREAAFDFSIPLGNGGELLATLPEKMEHPWWSAVRILISWGALKIVSVLVFLVALVGCTVWLVERRNNPEHFGGPPARGIGAGAYWVGSTLASGVCFGIPLKSPTGRIIGLCWMFTCTIALSALVASLASSFTLKQLTETSVDIRELMPLRLGAVKGGFSEEFVRSLGVEFTAFGNVEEALKALLNKEIDGFSYDGATLRFYEQRKYRGKISLHPTDSRARLSFGFGMPSGSPIRKPVNTALLALMSRQVWDHWVELYSIEEQYTEIKTRKEVKTKKAQNY